MQIILSAPQRASLKAQATERAPMEERRHLARHAVLKSAKIMFDSQSSWFDCTVCNITNDGACLTIAAATPVDESFALSFDNFRSTRACRVVWRQTDRLGVCFG